MRLGWLRASLRRALALVLAAGMLLASGVGLWGAWRSAAGNDTSTRKSM